MARLTRQANLRDEPDFLGLTEQQATTLAAKRQLQLRLIREGDEGLMTLEINSGRVTAELEGGVVIYAQRF
jgi:hypothetical protein